MAISIERAQVRNFEFTLGDSPEVHSMPLAAYFPCKFVREKMVGKSGKQLIFAMLDEFCPELADDESLDLQTVGAIYEAWNEACAKDGLDAGK